MTPYELRLENDAFEMKFKREQIINLQLLNTVSSFLGGESITFDQIFNYKTLADCKLKNINDFRENGKVNVKKWEKYLDEVIIPTKRELGLEV